MLAYYFYPFIENQKYREYTEEETLEGFIEAVKQEMKGSIDE